MAVRLLSYVDTAYVATAQGLLTPGWLLLGGLFALP